MVNLLYISRSTTRLHRGILQRLRQEGHSILDESDIKGIKLEGIVFGEGTGLDDVMRYFLFNLRTVMVNSKLPGYDIESVRGLGVRVFTADEDLFSYTRFKRELGIEQVI
jgi:hypothetical protein